MFQDFVAFMKEVRVSRGDKIFNFERVSGDDEFHTGVNQWWRVAQQDD